MPPSLSRTTSDECVSIHEMAEDIARHHSMPPERGSLRSKLVLSLAAMFLVFLATNEIVRHQVFAPEFNALERAGAIRDTTRVLAAIDAEVDHLCELNKHWSVDALDRDWQSSDLYWAAIASTHEPIQWLHGHECETDLAVGNLFQKVLASRDDPHQRWSSGITRCSDRSLVMFAVAGLNSAESGKLDRCLVVGRRIDESIVEMLREQTQVEFSLQAPQPADRSEPITLWDASPDVLIVEAQLIGEDQVSLANVFVQVPRDINDRANRTFAVARHLFILGSVAALLVLLLFLQRLVIGPLAAIRSHLDEVATIGLATKPLTLPGNDEIGELAGAFDQMVSRLGEVQHQLSEASQAAGRSEVAAAVIHNVGNVLTNVNSLIDTTSQRIEGLRVDPLNQLAMRLKQTDADDELLQATPGYLEGLASKWKTDQLDLTELLSTLDDNVRHIHDVLRDQQRHADHSVETKSLDLRSTLEEAIGCCRARLDDDLIAVELSELPSTEVAGDHSLLLQTMINVIGNARHAMRQQSEQPRRLQINVSQTSETVRVEFCDNGCGMTPETLKRIFHPHFTLRDGGTGLGLHFCANAVKRFGGSIWATSDGVNRGSTFVVELMRSKAPKRHSEASAVVVPSPLSTNTSVGMIS